MEASKPLATTGSRIGIAVLGLIGSGFILAAVFLPGVAISTFAFFYGHNELGIPPGTLTIISGIAMVLQWCLLPLFGFLGDLSGRVKFMLIGAGLACIGVALMGLVPSMVFWTAGVFVQRIGAAIAIASLLAYTLEATTSRWFLAYAAAGYLAGIYAYEVGIVLVANQILNTLGLRQLILIIAAASLGILVLGAVLVIIAGAMRKRRAWLEPWLDAPQSPRRGARLALLLVLACLAGIPMFFMTQSSTYLSLMDLFSYSAVLPIMGSLVLATLIGISLSGILADFLDGVLFRPGGRLFGRPGVMLLGSVIVIISAALFLLAGLRRDMNLGILLPAAILGGAGSGMLLPPLLALLAGQVRHRRWGLLMGIYTVLADIAIYIGSLIATGMLNASGYAAGGGQQSEMTISAVTVGMPVIELVFGVIIVGLSAVILVLASRRAPVPVVPPPEPPSTVPPA